MKREPDTTFMQRRVEHARRNWWGYSKTVAGTLVVLAVTAVWNWTANQFKDAQSHYREIDRQAASIDKLRIDCDGLIASNFVQQAQIEALESTNTDLRWWVRHYQAK